MNNFGKFSGTIGMVFRNIVIITMVAIMGLFVISCDWLFGDKEKDETIEGSLTITGLGAFEGYFLYAMGYPPNELLYAAIDVTGIENSLTIKGISIVNGSVTLPVWKLSYNYDNDMGFGFMEKTRYKGSDDVMFSARISEYEYYHWQAAEPLTDIDVSVTFKKGIATVVFDED